MQKPSLAVDLLAWSTTYPRKAGPARRPLETNTRSDWDRAAINKCSTWFGLWMLRAAYSMMAGGLLAWGLHPLIGYSYVWVAAAGMFGFVCCFVKMQQWRYRGSNRPGGVAYRQRLKDEAEARLQANDPDRTW